MSQFKLQNCVLLDNEYPNYNEIIKSLEKINCRAIIRNLWYIQKKKNVPFHVRKSLIERDNLGIIVGVLTANNRLSTVVLCKTNVPM